MSKTLFLTGATGYIGGAILAALLASNDAKAYDKIRVLVRGSDRVAKLKSLDARVEPVVGGNDDVELLERMGDEADVVIHTADSSDHMPSCRALLKGLERRSERTGYAPLYLHTSGTGVLADKSRGAGLSSHIYSDDDQAGIEGLADSQLHRLVDIEVRNAGLRGKVRCHIVIPPIIYGLSKGSFKNDTFFISPPILAAIRTGKAGYVGSGEPRWNTVHVDDLADFYILLLKQAGAEKWGGYYFTETGETSFKQIAEYISKALHDLTGKPASVGTWTGEEIKKGKIAGGAYIWGSNARCRTVRAKAMGWRPKYTAQNDFQKATKDQVGLLLAEEKQAKM